MTKLFSRLLGSQRSESGLRGVTVAPMRVGLEPLEDRQLFAAGTGLLPALSNFLAPSSPAGVVQPLNAQTTAAAKNLARTGLTSMLPISINQIVNQAGQLVALGSIGNTPISLPLTLSATPGTAGSCDVLNLHLGPIHLNLLGLNVDTSAICVNITGNDGAGNLLGNLVCGVAGALNNGLNLGNILNGLTSTQLSTLTTGLTNVLNGVLGALAAPTSVTGVSSGAGGVTNVLNLAVGPLNLNLLGLNVAADNCAGGPITLDITAVPGAGNLLGNLLGNLSNLANSGAAPVALTNALNRVAGAITGLLG